MVKCPGKFVNDFNPEFSQIAVKLMVQRGSVTNKRQLFTITGLTLNYS